MSDEAPPANRLDAAVRELEKYYTGTGFENSSAQFSDLGFLSLFGLGSSVTIEGVPGPMSDSMQDSQIRFLQGILYDNSEGGYFLKDIMNSIGSQFGSEIAASIGIKMESSIEPDSPVNDSARVEAAGGQAGVTECTAGVDRSSQLESSATPGAAAAAGDASTGAGARETVPEGNNSGDPDRIDNPTMGTVEIADYNLFFCNRHASAASIFMNSIPSIEMSQCAPYINLRFITDLPQFIGGFDTFNLVGFLGSDTGGPALSIPSLDGGSADTILASAVPINDDSNLFDIASGDSIDFDAAAVTLDLSSPNISITRQVANAGIELFTIPQTANNASQTGELGGPLNTMVPLMSLEQLTIDIAGLGQSILANKTATMQLVLHDRSQLSTISPIIAADSTSATYIEIEWGWSHAQGNNMVGSNVYADFLDSLKSKSIFNIQVSNVDFLDDGQVRVTLKLASRGQSDVDSLPIGSGVEHVSLSLIRPLAERIVAAVEGSKVRGTISHGESLSDSRRLQANAHEARRIHQRIPGRIRNVASPLTLIPISVYKDLLKTLRTHAQEPDQDSATIAGTMSSLTAAINVALDALDEQQTTTARYSTLTAEIERKNGMLNRRDLFADGGTPASESVTVAIDRQSDSQGAVEATSESTSSEETITFSVPTLGQLLVTMVGTPLQQSGKYDEVQWFFYPFNDHAAAMADVSLARFTVTNWARLYSELTVGDNVRISAYTIKSFINWVFGETVEKLNDPNYELTDYYNSISELRADDDIDPALRDSQISQIRDSLPSRLRTIYSRKEGPRNEKFTIPDVRVLMECVPALIGTPPSGKPSSEKNILRIHVYDANAGIPWEARLLQQIMNSDEYTVVSPGGSPTPPTPSDVDSDTAGARETNVSATRSSNRTSQFFDKLLEDYGIKKAAVQIENPDGSGMSDVEAYINAMSIGQIKDAIKSISPSITFGGQFTNITRISMRSETSGDVANTLLLNSIRDNAGNMGTDQDGGVEEDVFVIPTQATISCAGFPLVEYGQKFYIDMGSGTTADNFYYVVGIRHTLRSGDFTTNLTLRYNSSATMQSIRTALSTAAKTTDTNYT